MGCHCLKDKLEYEINNQRIDELSKSHKYYITINIFIDN